MFLPNLYVDNGFSVRWFQIELAREMGYSAARYGHVMFPENVYEPALRCAELLLEGVGKGWWTVVFLLHSFTFIDATFMSALFSC